MLKLYVMWQIGHGHVTIMWFRKKRMGTVYDRKVGIRILIRFSLLHVFFFNIDHVFFLVFIAASPIAIVVLRYPCASARGGWCVGHWHNHMFACLL
jgi:hypothetical protein